MGMLARRTVTGSLKPFSQSLVFISDIYFAFGHNWGPVSGCIDVFYCHEDLPFILALLILSLTRGSRLHIFVLTSFSVLFLWIWALCSSFCRIFSFCVFWGSWFADRFPQLTIFELIFLNFRKYNFDLFLRNITRRVDASRASLVPDFHMSTFYFQAFFDIFHIIIYSCVYILRPTMRWSPWVGPSVLFPARGGFLGGRARTDFQSFSLSLDLEK